MTNTYNYTEEAVRMIAAPYRGMTNDSNRSDEQLIKHIEKGPSPHPLYTKCHSQNHTHTCTGKNRGQNNLLANWLSMAAADAAWLLDRIDSGSPVQNHNAQRLRNC